MAAEQREEQAPTAWRKEEKGGDWGLNEGLIGIDLDMSTSPSGLLSPVRENQYILVVSQ